MDLARKRLGRRHPALPPGEEKSPERTSAIFQTHKLTMLLEPEPRLLGERISAAMNSEQASSHADVILVSTEGEHVPAVRMILTVSSSYFEKMLNSDFVEKKLRTVSVGVSTNLLKQVLEFIYTDDCHHLRLVRNKTDDFAEVTCHTVRDLVDLTFAADYVSHERLLSKCESALRLLMRKRPHLSSVVLQVLRQQELSWCRNICQQAIESVVLFMTDALLNKCEGCDARCGLLHLDDGTAKEVFGVLAKPNPNSPTRIFQALVVWASGGTALREGDKRVYSDDTSRFIDVDGMNVVPERLETAKQIATSFDISEFSPKFLSDVVEASGLVRSDAVNDAYKRLSLKYEEEKKELNMELASYRARSPRFRRRWLDYRCDGLSVVHDLDGP